MIIGYRIGFLYEINLSDLAHRLLHTPEDQACVKKILMICLKKNLEGKSFLKCFKAKLFQCLIYDNKAKFSRIGLFLDEYRFYICFW